MGLACCRARARGRWGKGDGVHERAGGSKTETSERSYSFEPTCCCGRGSSGTYSAFQWNRGTATERSSRRLDVDGPGACKSTNVGRCSTGSSSEYGPLVGQIYLIQRGAEDFGRRGEKSC